MSTWAEDRSNVADNRPRRWLADSTLTNHPSGDPELSDRVLEQATDGQIAHLLNLYGWPVRPNWSAELALYVRETVP